MTSWPARGVTGCRCRTSCCAELWQISGVRQNISIMNQRVLQAVEIIIIWMLNRLIWRLWSEFTGLCGSKGGSVEWTIGGGKENPRFTIHWTAERMTVANNDISPWVYLLSNKTELQNTQDSKHKTQCAWLNMQDSKHKIQYARLYAQGSKRKTQ